MGVHEPELFLQTDKEISEKRNSFTLRAVTRREHPLNGVSWTWTEFWGRSRIKIEDKIEDQENNSERPVDALALILEKHQLLTD